MKKVHCPLCKTRMKSGKTDLVMRRGKSVVVIEKVPALVCPQCGEASIVDKIAKIAFEIAEKKIDQGVSLEFCKFKEAA